MKNFIRYDSNGQIISTGYADSTAIEHEQSQNVRIIKIDLDNDFDPSLYKINISDKSLVKKTPEEILASTPISYVPPVEIFIKQFYQQLSIDGLITQADALNGVKGNIPKPVQDILNTVTDNSVKFSYEMSLSSLSPLTNGDDMANLILTKFGKNKQQIDEFFNSAKSL